MTVVNEWIRRLDLKPHPEGGYYRETYRSVETLTAANLPRRFAGDRAFSTAIYFLLKGSDFSALHRLKADEVWHFHAGFPLTIYIIDPAGQLSMKKLGIDGPGGTCPQITVEAGMWFGARLDDDDNTLTGCSDHYTLAGCTTAPGFDFADFELGTRTRLLGEYPQHRGIIEMLTRN